MQSLFLLFHGGEKHMKYISTSQAAEKWGLSQRRVVTLCEEGRISGTSRVGTTWIVPEDAEKPADARIKSGRYIRVKSE